MNQKEVSKIKIFKLMLFLKFKNILINVQLNLKIDDDVSVFIT